MTPKLDLIVESFDTVRWNREEDLPSWQDPDNTYIVWQTAVNFRDDVYVFGGRPELYHEISGFRFDGSWTRIQRRRF